MNLLAFVMMDFALFIVGITTFMCGCDTSIIGACPMYHVIQGVGQNYTIEEQLLNDKEFYRGYVEIRMNHTGHCRISVASGQDAAIVIRDTYSEPLGQQYELYMYVMTGQCSEDANMRTKTYIGMAFLLMWGIYSILGVYSQSHTDKILLYDNAYAERKGGLLLYDNALPEKGEISLTV